MRRPLALTLLIPALVATAVGGASPAAGQGRATGTVRPVPPALPSTQRPARLGDVLRGRGAGVSLGLGARDRGYGSGTVVPGRSPRVFGSGLAVGRTVPPVYGGGVVVVRDIHPCGAWLGGTGYFYEAGFGLRSADGGVTIGLGSPLHLGRAPLFWHADHLGVRRSGSYDSCAAFASTGSTAHDALHRSLERDHAQWHARHPRERADSPYWEREHGRLHARLEEEHARWHASHGYDWARDHGAKRRLPSPW